MIVRLLWIAMLTTTVAFAQRAGGGGAGRDAGGGSDVAFRTVRLTKAQMLANQLKLTEEQRDQVQKILNDTAKEVAPVRAQIENVRTQIVGSIINAEGENELKKGMDTLAAAESQLTGIEAKSYAQVCALLKPNQQSRAAAAFDLWASVLDPPGNSGRGGFTAGGRRGKD